MPKIDGLQTIKTKLKLSQLAYVRSLLYQSKQARARRDEYLQAAGLLAVLLAEVGDHIHNLKAIQQAAAHGLAATVPDDYDEWGYGEHDESKPYDPYADMLYALESESSVSCLELSRELEIYIDSVPEMERRTGNGLAQLFGSALVNWQPDGTARPLTEAERNQYGEEAMIRGVEETLFSTSYAQDMQRVKLLAQARAPFARIMELL
jgi:hypothetical protein